jgi:meckelin
LAISFVLNSRTRNGAAVDGSFALRALFDGIGCAARWMFVLMFLGCFEQWFSFKMQSGVSLLPTANDIEPFRVMLSTGFIAKLISIAHVLWRQCQVDVFFIDWEKSHGRLVDLSPDGGEAGSQKDVMAPVSYWRNIFITNEWSELQTSRMVNVELTLLGLVFLLRGLNLDNLATSNPDVEDLRGPEDGGSSIDPILHFFIGSFFIILLSGAQIAFRKIYYHPYVSNPLERFKDLMTCANISTIILADKFCGYYVGSNGAPHPHMDTDMAGITSNFKKEREGKTRPRGLFPSDDGGDDAIQSFVLFVTPKIRGLYEGQFNTMAASRNRGMPGNGGETPALKAYDSLNKMFRKFVNTKDPKSDYAKEV